MAYDYSKLNGKIVEKYGTQGNFAKEIGLSERAISLKLNNKAQFKQGDIEKFCTALNIKRKDVAEYFFCEAC